MVDHVYRLLVLDDVITKGIRSTHEMARVLSSQSRWLRSRWIDCRFEVNETVRDPSVHAASLATSVGNRGPLAGRGPRRILTRAGAIIETAVLYAARKRTAATVVY